MKKSRKLSMNELKMMVLEEKAKMSGFGALKSTEKAAKETKEVAANGQQDTLEKKIDYIKVLKIKEEKYRNSLRSVLKEKKRILKSLMEALNG